MNKKLILKITAGTTALLIIIFIFMIFNAFMGNPISAAIATTKIKEYVEETYPNLELDVPKAGYNFKGSSYYSMVESKISKDTRFSIAWSKGRIEDSYEYEVENHFTTYRRLSEEFDKAVTDIIIKDFPYETSILFADIGKGNDEFKKLVLDMELDITNPPISTSLTIYILSQDVSYEFLEARLIELHNLMEEHHIPLDYYSVVIQEQLPEEEKVTSDQDSIYLSDFPVDKILSDDLIETMKEHQKEQDAGREKK